MSAQNGIRFPNRPSSGKRVPEFGSRVGCVFRLKPQAETASRNSVSERDELSQRGRMRKLCPGIMPQNGMRFPLAGRLESASQFECLFRDAVSAEGLNRKACPALRRDSGTRFPPGPPSGKCIPFLSVQARTHFPLAWSLGKRGPDRGMRSGDAWPSSSYRSTSLSHVGSAVCRMPAVCSFLASIPAGRTSFMVKRSRGWP